MMPFFTFIFVMVITAVVFGAWVVVTVARLIWRATMGGSGALPLGTGRQCMNPGCRGSNPNHAHFCRRCGSNLTEPIATRRLSQPQPRFNPTDGRGRQMAQI
jgi:hypothetical protein